MEKNEKKKPIYFFYACLIFAATMYMFTVTGTINMLLVMLVGNMIGGARSAGAVYNFFAGHINLYTVFVYTPVLFLFGLLYYVIELKPRQIRGEKQCNAGNLGVAAYAGIGMLALALNHCLALFFGVLDQILPKQMEEYVEMMESAGVTDYSIVWAVGTLILPPLAEEIIFRGLMTKMFRECGLPFVIVNLLQAVAFGIFHMNLVQGMYAAILGLILGYLAHQYGTLLAPMLFHFLFNLFGTALSEWENKIFSEQVYTVLVYLSIPLFGIGLYLIYRRVGDRRKIKEMETEQL